MESESEAGVSKTRIFYFFDLVILVSSNVL
jgi:hypothetical protein